VTTPYTTPDTVVLRFPTGVKIKLSCGAIDVTLPHAYHTMHSDTLAYLYELGGKLWPDAPVTVEYKVRKEGRELSW
jgi:hypothetical protein